MGSERSEGDISDTAEKWETVWGNQSYKGSKLKLGHVEFGGTSVCSSPLKKSSSGLSMEVLYTFMTCENAWVGRGEMCISQRKELKINSWRDSFI